MSQVSGEITKVFSALADVNPYVDADLSYSAQAGSAQFQILSGVCKQAAPLRTLAVATIVPARTADTITLKMQVARASTDTADDEYLVVINPSTGNGYGLKVNANLVRIQIITNWAPTQLVATANQTFAIGQDFSFEFNFLTGQMRSYMGTTLLTTVTDTTHTTGLLGGFGKYYDNSNNYGLQSFAADGYASGPTIDTSDAQARTGGSVNFTVSNFTGAITGANINDGTFAFNASSVVDNGGGSYTANFPSLSTLPITPAPTTGLTFEATNATESAMAVIELLPDAGFTDQIAITPAVGLMSRDWGFNQPNLSAGDYFVTRDADTFVTHNTNGTSNASSAGASLVYGWDSLDGQWSSIQITYEGEGGSSIKTNNIGISIKVGI